MARDITEREKEIIINCGAFNFQPDKIANIINWPTDEVRQHFNNKTSEFCKLLQEGRDKADYVLTLKLFEMARAGDLKAIEEFESRRDS